MPTPPTSSITIITTTPTAVPFPHFIADCVTIIIVAVPTFETKAVLIMVYAVQVFCLQSVCMGMGERETEFESKVEDKGESGRCGEDEVQDVWVRVVMGEA